MTERPHPMHLDPQSVEEYFRLGAKAAFDLLDAPIARMEIDPGREIIELVTPAIGADPEVTALERLSFGRFPKGGGEWFRLTVDATDMHYEAYVLIESVVDQLRSGATFRHAVSESIISLKELLAGRRQLTEEKTIGLIGELLVLREVVKRDGESPAIEAWLGPMAEEHDFSFRDFDAEVKTTKSESRTHIIGSETQLERSPGRPLYLVSVQVTRAGAAKDGFTLPALIRDVRARLDQTRRPFDRVLESLGWRDDDADLYRVGYHLRSVPRAYLVDEEFPAITAARLDAVVPNRINVSAVTYRVNVTDLDHSSIPAPLHIFCEAPA